MTIWKSKSCPRCGGDMFLEGGDKWYEHCLQCGYTHELKSLPEFYNHERHLVPKEVKPYETSKLGGKGGQKKKKRR
jgi:ribosomal protein S27AE